MFWSKPTGGPDVAGGIWPVDFPEVRCINRSGGTHTKGEVVQMAWQPGVATEIATNDSNSYKPGWSNDTIWNTVIDPVTNATLNGGTLRRQTLYAVCTSDSVADNAQGNYKFFGIVEQAFCIKASGASLAAGSPLSVTITNSFNGLIASNAVVVATYIDIQATNTVRRLRRVLLHNGFLAGGLGTTANT